MHLLRRHLSTPAEIEDAIVRGLAELMDGSRYRSRKPDARAYRRGPGSFRFAMRLIGLGPFKASNRATEDIRCGVRSLAPLYQR